MKAGRVATDPMTVNFLPAAVLGIASARQDRDLVNGFKLIAMAAMAPIVSVMAPGTIVTYKKSRS